jgi:nitrogen fixation protein NifU and related proteins
MLKEYSAVTEMTSDDKTQSANSEKNGLINATNNDKLADDLYRQELLDLYRNPTNKGTMLKPDIKTEEQNPLCGDQVEISLRLDKNGKVADAQFDGKGCVISMASTSLLLEKIKGKTLSEVLAITREDLLDMIGLSLTPTRVKCAMLPLVTVKKGIVDYEAKKTKK